MQASGTIFLWAVLLVAGLYFSVRVLCRNRSTSEPATRSADRRGSTLIRRLGLGDLFVFNVNWAQASPSHRRAFETGLEKSVLENLPNFTFNPGRGQFDSCEIWESMTCSVCLEEFMEGEEGRLLPKCRHCFHVNCIDKWFYSHSTCPLCRCEVTSDPVESLYETIPCVLGPADRTAVTNAPHRFRNADVPFGIAATPSVRGSPIPESRKVFSSPTSQHLVHLGEDHAKAWRVQMCTRTERALQEGSEGSAVNPFNRNSATVSYLADSTTSESYFVVNPFSSGEDVPHQSTSPSSPSLGRIPAGALISQGKNGELEFDYDERYQGEAQLRSEIFPTDANNKKSGSSSSTSSCRHTILEGQSDYERQIVGDHKLRQEPISAASPDKDVSIHKSPETRVVSGDAVHGTEPLACLPSPGVPQRQSEQYKIFINAGSEDSFQSEGDPAREYSAATSAASCGSSETIHLQPCAREDPWFGERGEYTLGRNSLALEIPKATTWER